MAFLDFIKNRFASGQQPVANKTQQQKPEAARPYFTRMAAQEKAALKPTDQLPADARKELESIRASRDRVIWPQGHPGSQAISNPTESGSANNPEPLRQNMTGQEKTAPALSPTGDHKGQPATEKASANGQEKPVERPKTVPRPKPSWER